MTKAHPVHTLGAPSIHPVANGNGKGNQNRNRNQNENRNGKGKRIAKEKGALRRSKLPPPEPIPAKASLPVNTAQKQGLIAPFNNGKNRTPPPVKLSREPGRKPNQLIVERDGQETVGDSNARIVASPVLANVSTIARFASSEGQPDVTTLAMSITASAERIQAGDTSDIKAMLLSQAQACQAIFSEMARRSALNLGQHLGHAETYMRLALKAQAQSRATLETLAEIVSPRPVYINPQQVNHANGPQQVNNSIPARVRESDISSNKLLEGK